MSGTISNLGSVFVSTPSATIAVRTLAEDYAANGITDVALSNQYSDASNNGAQSALDFLNNLTPSQLKESTFRF